MPALILIIVLAVILLFGIVVFVGAPYLPTLRPQAEVALKMLDLKKGQTLFDLGCGDGKILSLAAQQGIKAVGVEINLFLVIIAWLRTRRYGQLVTVRWGNFWTTSVSDADGIFVFLHTRFMQRLHKKIINECQVKPVKLVSYAFRIPEKSISDEKQGMLLYMYN